VTPALAAAGPSAYWYLTRGTGAVALVLLTASVVLGVLGSLRFSLAPRWPRFAIDALHRDVSLLALAFLAVHIITSVLDSFAPIKLTDAVIPFAGTYRPLWLGLGALAFDILVALTVTSLLRRRVGYRRWRLIHWLAYASWPVAVLHGLGTGTDTKVWWMLALTGACVAAVTIATLARISRSDFPRPELRAPATALSIAAPVGLAIFTLAGPLQQGWARRAGTPTRLLARASPPPATTVRVTAPRRTLRIPFSAGLAGTATQTTQSGGAIIDLELRLTGRATGRLRIRLGGTPLGNGGLSLTGSQVDLLANGLPWVMEGKIVSLEGQQLVAHVSNGSGTGLSLDASLNIDGGSGTVTGTLRALPTRSG
jgi:methionine sulfoxide reductase heme-binding subunit